jgi:hypothetical protein
VHEKIRPDRRRGHEHSVAVPPSRPGDLHGRGIAEYALLDRAFDPISAWLFWFTSPAGRPPHAKHFKRRRRLPSRHIVARPDVRVAVDIGRGERRVVCPLDATRWSSRERRCRGPNLVPRAARKWRVAPSLISPATQETAGQSRSQRVALLLSEQYSQNKWSSPCRRRRRDPSKSRDVSTRRFASVPRPRRRSLEPFVPPS